METKKLSDIIVEDYILAIPLVWYMGMSGIGISGAILVNSKYLWSLVIVSVVLCFMVAIGQVVMKQRKGVDGR